MVESLVLVDSSIWIEGIDPKVPVGLKTDLVALIEAERAAVTNIIRMEVIGGARSSGEFEKARSDFAAFRCLETTSREWRMAEDLSFALNRKGARVPPADILIAAVAVCYGIPLWHADTDFERIAKVASDLKTFWYPKQSPPMA